MFRYVWFEYPLVLSLLSTQISKTAGRSGGADASVLYVRMSMSSASEVNVSLAGFPQYPPAKMAFCVVATKPDVYVRFSPCTPAHWGMKTLSPLKTKLCVTWEPPWKPSVE